MAMKGVSFIGLITSFHIYLSVLYTLTSPISSSPSKYHKREANGHSYGVLLDAGSSSTKLKVYRWDSSTSGSLVPKIDLITNERFNEALTEHEHNMAGLNKYIQDIVSRAKQDVPADEYSKTPIFLMATAGLRFLSEDDASVFVEKTKSVLANKTINPFIYTPSGVSILSGEEEGVYSWIAANYLMGFFDKHRPDNESVGILEMGGGSTQIAFIPKGPIFSEEYKVTVAGRAYQLYVQSYLQFGANAIKLKIAHELHERRSDQDEIDNPCMLKGDKSKIRLEDDKTLNQRGTGSPAFCKEILWEILKPYTGMRCQPKPCAIGSVYQPSVADQKFLAIQAFTYTPVALKVVSKDDEMLSIDRLETAAERYCSKNLRQVVNESGINEEHASDHCLMGLYMPSLLTTSYGFNRNTTNIRLTSSIGSAAIDWALGAMLVELSNTFDSSSPYFAVTCKPRSNGHSGSGRANNLSLSLPLWMLEIIIASLSLYTVFYRNSAYFTAL